MNTTYDTAVVGAGIVGLAHAYQLARRGQRVIVFERRPRAAGASVRNFGMLWPIGQPAGDLHRLACRSLEQWHAVLQASGLWSDRIGSLHLAYHEDEAQVLWEFVADPRNEPHGCRLLSGSEVSGRSPWVRTEGLLLAMWSQAETCVDPRQVIGGLPGWLERSHGVRFAFGQAVTGYDPPAVQTSAGRYAADRLVVCSGDEFQMLYPDVFASQGLIRCKLQMMRSPPLAPAIRLGPMLAAGLTLRHYKAFAQCPTLPDVERRIAASYPEYVKYGIHVMAAQNGQGEIVIGDSHEYGDAIEPFDKPEIDDLILRYLHTFLRLPNLSIAARWHGVYAKHPTHPYVIARLTPGVTVVAGLGGAGMTLSFGLADQVVGNLLMEA